MSQCAQCVKVLVQAVQQEGEQLLAVLLRVALELGCEARDVPLEGNWGHASHAALHSEWQVRQAKRDESVCPAC